MSWYCQAGPDFVLWCAQDGGFKYWKMEFKMGSGPWQRGIHHNNIPNSTGCFLFVCFLIQMPRHGRTYLTMVLIFNGLRWRRQPGCILCGTFSLDLPKHKVERWCSCCKLAASCFATDPYGLRGFILRFQLPLPGFFINLFNTGPNGGESSKQTYGAISNAASCFFQTVKHLSRMEVSSWGSQHQWWIIHAGIGQSPPWGDVSDDLEVFKEAMKMFTAISSQQKTNGDLTKDRFMKMNNICIHISIFSKIECSTYYIIMCIYIYNYI